MAKTTFMLGGARSGKSAYAERLAMQSPRAKIYVATAQVQDDEMQARISAHRHRRGSKWTTLEIPLAIAEAIENPAYAEAIILVDCLTLWLSNLMHQHLSIPEYTDMLLHALQHTRAEILLVSNEVGQGIVPDNALARQFRDHAGVLHQKIAEAADNVIFITAGLPSVLKGSCS